MWPTSTSTTIALLCTTHCPVWHTALPHTAATQATASVDPCSVAHTLYQSLALQHTVCSSMTEWRCGSVEAWTELCGLPHYKLCGLREKSHGWRYQATGLDIPSLDLPGKSRDSQAVSQGVKHFSLKLTWTDGTYGGGVSMGFAVWSGIIFFWRMLDKASYIWFCVFF